MFSFVIWTLLMVLKLGASSDCCCETDLANSFYCDDTALKGVWQKMELLESGNEILRLNNLNGQYLKVVYPREMYAKVIDWNTWHGHCYSLKYVHMAIQPLNPGE